MLGDNIRALREARGWSKSKLAGQADLTEDAIRKLEAGARLDPQLSTVQAIARALEVTTSELLGEAPPDITQARDIERTVMGLRVPNPRAFLAKLAGALENELRLVELMLDGFVDNRQGGGSGNHNSGGSFIKERIERGIRTAPADKN